MRITRLSWTNYKGLRDDEIVADGANVTVLGQNGVGKTTIAEMFSFILFGLDRGDTLTRYEGGRKQADDDLIHAAQVEFDDGMTIRREICNGKPLMVVNGTPKTVTEFKSDRDKLLCNADKLLFDPFYFHDDKRMGKGVTKDAITNRRDLLAKIFGGLDEKEFLTPEEEKFLGGEKVSLFIEHTKKRLQKLKGKLAQTKNFVTEREHDKDEMPADLPKEIARLEGQIAKLQAEKKSLEEERDKLNRPLPTDAAKEHDQLTKRVAPLQEDINYLNSRLLNLQNNGSRLRNELKALNDAEPGRCPTCGQIMPREKFEQHLNDRRIQINADGQNVNKEYRDAKKKLAGKITELTETEKQIGELAKLAQEQVANEEKRKARLDEVKASIAELEKEIDAFKKVLSDYENAAKADERIAELQNEQKQLNKELARLETQMDNSQ